MDFTKNILFGDMTCMHAPRVLHYNYYYYSASLFRIGRCQKKSVSYGSICMYVMQVSYYQFYAACMQSIVSLMITLTQWHLPHKAQAFQIFLLYLPLISNLQKVLDKVKVCNCWNLSIHACFFDFLHLIRWIWNCLQRVYCWRHYWYCGNQNTKRL